MCIAGAQRNCFGVQGSLIFSRHWAVFFFELFEKGTIVKGKSFTGIAKLFIN